MMIIIRSNENGTEYFGSKVPELVLYGLAVFLVLFPKGGFKAGPLPLTWGYALVGLVLLLGTPVWLSRFVSSPKVPRAAYGAFLSLLPLQILFIYGLLAGGIAEGELGFAVGDFINFFVLPFAFLAIFPQFLPEIRMERLLAVVRWMVVLAAAYGIFLFIWRFVTGKYIEVPFLTVNVGDVGSLDDKFNSRPGGFFKLISTYNNGNLYGVATLLLLPLVDMAKGHRFQKLMVRVALILTLSRTVWVGLALNEAISAFKYVGRDLLTRSGLSIRYSSLSRFGGLVLVTIVVLGMALILSGVSFLFDPSFGGRASYLENPEPISILPTGTIGNFAEVIYFSALEMLGVTGLIAIVLLFFSPLLLVAVFQELRQTRVQIAALSGLLLYTALAAMDGVLNYIPTMAFYWFLWMLLIYSGQMRTNGLEARDAANWA